MKLSLLSAGVWLPGATHWSAFEEAMHRGAPTDAPSSQPTASALPGRERRRASLPIRLGVEVAAQACDGASLAYDVPTSIFASAMADTDVTDYMCRALAAPPVMLSPTRFHNSVHNAAVGYWSIAAGNHRASSYVGAGEYTVAAALLEAFVTASTEPDPVLLVALDIATHPPFDDVRRIDHSLGVALVVAAAPKQTGVGEVALRRLAGATPDCMPSAPWLVELARDNPSAKSLALLEAVATRAPRRIRLALGANGGIELDYRPHT